jgi:prepilin-type processing-associated H-X9-DG protein
LNQTEPQETNGQHAVCVTAWDFKGAVTVSKIAPDPKVPSQNDRELTAGELDAIAAGTILQVNGGGNTPHAAGSGANFALCDGSVRFIKNSLG